MRKLKEFTVHFLLLILLLPAIAFAQSDSQTLRSPYASLVGIADFDFGLPAGSGRKYPLSLGGSGNSHYNGNAETYMNVGEAMGKAMVKLLKM